MVTVTPKSLVTILEDYITLPEYLGFENIQVNTKSNFSDYPINIASTRGDIDDIKILLESGADINTKGDGDYTPLHNAVEQEHYETVKYLLELNADKNIKNKRGLTPLDLAKVFDYKEIIALLG